MTQKLFVLFGFLGGAAAGWSLTVAAYILITDAGVTVGDGGLGLEFAFNIGLVVGLVLGIAGAFLVVRERMSC